MMLVLLLIKIISLQNGVTLAVQRVNRQKSTTILLKAFKV